MKYPALGPIVETGYRHGRSWMVVKDYLSARTPTTLPAYMLCGYTKLPLWHPWLELSDDELAEQLGEYMPPITYRDENGWIGFRTNGPNDWWPAMGTLWLKILKRSGRPVIEWSDEKVKFATHAIADRAAEAESQLKQLPQSWTSGVDSYFKDVAARAHAHAMRHGWKRDPGWAAEREELLSNGFGPWITGIEARARAIKARYR